MLSETQALMVTSAASWSVQQKKMVITLCLVNVFAALRFWMGQELTRENSGSGPVAQCHAFPKSIEPWSVWLMWKSQQLLFFHYTLKGRITGNISKGLLFLPKREIES